MCIRDRFDILQIRLEYPNLPRQIEAHRRRFFQPDPDLVELFVIEALRNLFADENFVNLLRAEGLESLPAPLADRINLGGVM